VRDPLFWVPVKYKLPLSFVFICLVAFGVGGVVVTSTAKEALQRQIHTRLDERALATRMVVEHHLDLLRRRTEDFASDGYIRTQLADVNAGRPGAPERLREHLRLNKIPLVDAFVDAAVLDMAGKPVIEVYGPAAAGAAATTTITSLKGPDDRRTYPWFAIATPLRDIDGNDQIGTLVLQVRADTWTRGMAEMAELPETGPISLADAGGVRLRLGGGLIPQRAIEYESDIPGTAWRLLLAVDRDAAMQPIAVLTTRYLTIGAILLAITALVLVFPVRFLLAPLGRIRDAARRMTDGDLGVRVAYDSKDEIGDLSRAFDLMAGAVEERTGELERSERDTRLERDRLDAVIKSMHDGLFILDPSGNVTLSNDAAKPIVEGLEKGAAEPSRDCDGHAGLRCLHCLPDRTVKRACLIDVEKRVFEVHVTALPGSTGRLCVSRDVTERLAQAEMQTHQERMSVLGNISAVMAHELNNPLAAIAMFSQMLESQLENGSAKESAEVIRRNAETCKRTIRGLLDTAGQSPPQSAPFDLQELADDVGRFLMPIYQRAGIEFMVQAEGKQSPVVGDELQLRQVLINLVMNAVHAMDAGGRVIVRIARDDDRGYEIEVADTGSGIPAKLRGRIFDAFFTTKPPGIGTGLGLSTSRRIVAGHGGTLELAKTSPEGTTFRISLPCPAVPVEAAS